MNINIAEIIQAFKNIRGPRFYFLTTLLFLSLLVYTFQDALVTKVKDITFEQVEFREIRDLKGLEVALERLYDPEIYNSYTVYIYQPKQKSFYKRMILTNSDLVKAVSKLQGSYIEDQPTINEHFKLNNYIILDHEHPKPDTQYLHDIGFQYLFICKLQNYVTIGEIHVSFIKKPTEDQIIKLNRQLAPLLHMYVN